MERDSSSITPTIQDTNDRFLANLQRGGSYSVIPRVPGGEITPEKLIVLGQVARKYGLYSKITGGQRIDLFGAAVHQLPDIWEELVNAGFESGHAYGKALRTVKSCVGTTWCRYGVQDSVGFAIRVENRYKGVRSPHKVKAAVSGCVRECAEAQSKDFGIIATEKGWNLYVCGNGGAKPRHADLLAADIDEETCIKYIDRFLMYYIQTADRLTRTAVWLEKMEGGIQQLRDVIVTRQPRHLRGAGTDRCSTSWTLTSASGRRSSMTPKSAVSSSSSSTPTRRNRPSSSSSSASSSGRRTGRRISSRSTSWAFAPGRSGAARRGAAGAGRAGPALGRGRQGVGLPARRRGDRQVRQDANRRVQLRQPRRVVRHPEHVSAPARVRAVARHDRRRQNGKPKVACPVHKKTYSLESGQCLSGDDYTIQVFAVKVEGDDVYLQLPPVEELDAQLATERTCNGSSCRPPADAVHRTKKRRQARTPELLPADPYAETL